MGIRSMGISVLENELTAEQKTKEKKMKEQKTKEQKSADKRVSEKAVSEETVSRKTTPKKKASAKKASEKTVSEKAVSEKTAAKKKATAKKKESRQEEKALQENAVKKASSGTAGGRKTAGGERVNTENIDEEDFKARSDRRDAERARRREERLKKVRRQKIIMAVSAGVIVVSVIILAVIFLSPAKYLYYMSKGDRYLAQADYVSAVEAYEKALACDDASAGAYHGAADALTAQEKISEAESVVYTGWQKTQDENLLHYYCTLVLNEAVEQINAKNCTLDTVDKCIQALEADADSEDALSLMHTCYERLFAVSEEDEICTLFYDEDVEQDTCEYSAYEELLRRIFAVYQEAPSEELKAVLAQYAVIDMPQVRISMTHTDQYADLLTEINGVIADAQITETLACLAKAEEVEDYFARAFAEFEQGNYAYARELIAENAYQQIRDQFINENSGYWKGSVYIPVSKEQLVLNREEGNITFSFLGYEDYVNPKGIITVWGSKQEDDGVQRSVISYEPASESGEAFPHTEYTIQYLYSNVKINGEYVPQMNYRFDTKITTEEGTTTNAVGDWGGEHEFEIDY